MFALLALLVVTAEATVVGAGQCPSSHNNVTIQNTFQASQPCENTTRLREEFPSFVDALCNSSICCTVLNTSIDIVECDIILDVKIDCNCATIDSGPCIRQANRINENLQDDIIQLHFGKPEWKVTSSSLLLEEDVCYGIVPGQHSTCSACERTITGVYGDFNTSDIDVSEGEKCRYTVCANTVAASYLLIGFFEAPQNIPATIQQGVCSQQNENQPILTTCYGETKPCLTIVSSNCACVRSTKPTRTSYGAFYPYFLEAVEYIISLNETIAIAKKPQVWSKLEDVLSDPTDAKLWALSIDPDFQPLTRQLPWRYYQLLFLGK